MKRIIFLLGFAIIMYGCAQKEQNQPPPEVELEPVVVYRSLGTTYILSCLNDSKIIGRGAFDFNFEEAEKDLESGRDIDKLRFICLSFNEKADQQQFKKGLEVFTQYIEEHPDAGEDILGLKVLADRLNQEILNRWSAWKTLLSDKKQLTAEVESLKLSLEKALSTNDELQKQIEQLKNIDEIIKSRETNQP